jgi:DNA repair exonuclease SbcCD ATPase subunit
MMAAEANAELLRGAQAKLKVLSAAEAALGLRGARVQLLARMLSGLEAAANVWLARVASNSAGTERAAESAHLAVKGYGQMRLHLKPYVEKKTGGIADALSLEVEGAGGGFGYRAASQGERRRIDVALLLALADVAAASHGVSPGTLFFDEVFDSLDDAGVDAVCEVLGGLARDRCVVVVTHSPGLANRVQAGTRIKVADGRLERV